jgi:hypothetical protein
VALVPYKMVDQLAGVLPDMREDSDYFRTEIFDEVNVYKLNAYVSTGGLFLIPLRNLSLVTLIR